MAREIVCIPARPESGSLVSGNQPGRIRMAAYCRVSSQNEDQLYSLENQVTYYRNYTSANPKFTLIDIYADEGISGMNTKNRLEFQRMIQDCRDGKIDIVITKSVTRFARNTQDCLKYARELKDLGIGVLFEKENINTMDGAGELLFTILASLAQDECRSISENTKWGIRSLYRQGVVHLNTNNFLGYDKDENGKLVINQSEAEIVRRVFREFLEGFSPNDIARRLLAERIVGVRGKAKWSGANILLMLRNEKYRGDVLCQKTYVADYLTGRIVTNEGELEQVLIKQNHEPIVPIHIWLAVQQEIKRCADYRKKYKLRVASFTSASSPFSARVICGKCHQPYTQRTWYRDGRRIKVWQCRSRYQTKGAPCCGNTNLHDHKLKLAFEMAWKEVLFTRDNRQAEWERKMREGSELEAYRAEQMIELMKPGSVAVAPDAPLVNMVLDHLIHLGDKVSCYFLDGSEVKVDIIE